jgi:hypothetical protein
MGIEEFDGSKSTLLMEPPDKREYLIPITVMKSSAKAKSERMGIKTPDIGIQLRFLQRGHSSV